MKLPIILAALLVASGCGKQDIPTTQVHVIEIGRYEQGVNDALQAEALLNLEQILQGTNRSRLNMAKIVCKRLGVKCTVFEPAVILP